jgi:hypothetical protein
MSGTDYTDICVATPVVRWEGQRGGRHIRTAYCAECAPSESPPATWAEPVTLTVLPGCPDDVREASEERERVIRARAEGTDGTDGRVELVEAFESWIDGHLDSATPSLFALHDGTEAIEFALADAIAERRRLSGANRTPEAT